MAVDANRAQALFLAVLEAGDSARQAEVLDRECASDAELRQRVEALLRAHMEQATILDVPGAAHADAAPHSLLGTMAFDPPGDPKDATVVAPRKDLVSAQPAPKESE